MSLCGQDIIQNVILANINGLWYNFIKILDHLRLGFSVSGKLLKKCSIISISRHSFEGSFQHNVTN